MPPPIKTCICGTVFLLPANTDDAVCPDCGRVYNYQGRFLWLSKKGEPVPGGEDHRAEDQDAALEQGFAEAKLPPEDRRTDEEELKAAFDQQVISETQRLLVEQEEKSAAETVALIKSLDPKKKNDKELLFSILSVEDDREREQAGSGRVSVYKALKAKGVK